MARHSLGGTKIPHSMTLAFHMSFFISGDSDLGFPSSTAVQTREVNQSSQTSRTTLSISGSTRFKREHRFTFLHGIDLIPLKKSDSGSTGFRNTVAWTYLGESLAT